MDEITIHVTWEDIERGIRGRPTLCAIACAARREFLDAMNIVVGSFMMSVVTVDDDYLDFYFPAEAIRFVEEFDTSQQVEPFKFTAWKDARRVEPFEFDLPENS